MTKDEEEH